MIMLSLKHTGQVPFREVFCHSLIRDSEGRKMSKSLGNVISPLDVMHGISLSKLHQSLHEGNLAEREVAKAEMYQNKAFPKGIPECGADALRFSLVQYTTGGGDIAFSVDFISAIRRFVSRLNPFEVVADPSNSPTKSGKQPSIVLASSLRASFLTPPRSLGLRVCRNAGYFRA
jgi:valyl-tRNA synthetase